MQRAVVLQDVARDQHARVAVDDQVPHAARRVGAEVLRVDIGLAPRPGQLAVGEAQLGGDAQARAQEPLVAGVAMGHLQVLPDARGVLQVGGVTLTDGHRQPRM